MNPSTPPPSPSAAYRQKSHLKPAERVCVCVWVGVRVCVCVSHLKPAERVGMCMCVCVCLTSNLLSAGCDTSVTALSFIPALTPLSLRWSRIRAA